MNRRQLILFAGLIASVVLSWWLHEKQDSFRDRYGISQQGPDLFIRNMDLKVTGDDGKTRYRVMAEHMDHYPHADHSELERPVLEVFSQERMTWRINSERGKVADSGDTIWLLGEVDIRRIVEPGTRPLNISTRDVLVKPETETAETDQAAVITSNQSVVESVGLHADFINNRVELRSRVRGRIDVAG